MRVRRINGRRSILAATLVLAMAVVFLSILDWLDSAGDTSAGLGEPTGYPQLVSVTDYPDYSDMCEPLDRAELIAASIERNLRAVFGGTTVYAAAQSGRQAIDITRQPIRTIRDMDPIYSGVAVDTESDEVILVDNNNWAIRIFDRLENTPANARFSEPKRVIQGPNTRIQYNNGVYVDSENGDIYSVETDGGNKVVVFPRSAEGNVAPERIIEIPHRGFSLAMDEEAEELLVGVQYPPEVAVFRKGARDDEGPLRSLQGESTRLSDVHGVAIDPVNKLMFVNSWGHVSDYATAGSGRFEDESITVYPLEADGDTAPLRVIQGPQTQLNWASQMSIDVDRGEIFVANDIGHSVLVFKTTDEGNVAPTRVIKGAATGLANPAGIFVDTVNQEFWMANFGNASATVFPLDANGNVAPLRTIRSAPPDKVSLKFGKVEALAYDEGRDQIWVPN